MKKEEIEGLVKLRSYMIEYYKTLDGGQNSGTAVTMQRDVAIVLETVVREMDDLLSEYVRFE
jgi:hypothetical protein